MKIQKQENYWTSLSDIMTGLMVIFLFISISYMLQIQKKQKEKDKIVEDFQNTKVELYKELKNEFESDFKKEKWHAVLDEDLSIRFLNEKVLFDYDDYILKPEFKSILDDFFPRYLNILMQKKYKDKILEVRIEGHTDSKGDYLYNVELSQNRTRSVLSYVLNQTNILISNHPLQDQKKVRFWLIANGFSSGRTLDNDGNYTLESNKPEDYQRSRRVEFRIVTKTEDVIEEIIKKMQD
ncbi:MAG: OmpA family protein [Ignavibacteriales bacterium]|nr:OmpA family protein [Ignavibacteriales bacterium]